MKTKPNFSVKSIISMILAISMILGTLPVMTAFAAQSNEYVDPVDRWLETNSRTNELDMNATITYETQYCPVCKKSTTVMTYRTPEYTKSGDTALNHNVFYSDGMNFDGTQRGNTDSGTPGVNAYYTGYHYTKSVCQNCGTINSVDGEGAYDFNKNVYALNSCDHDFFIDFDNTSYEPYSVSYHTTTLKKGEYCQFCKGTFARATEKREAHNFTETVDAQLGNNRFYVSEDCDDCKYHTSEYVTAKSVISSYYGLADGDAHTLTVSDLSDSGVKTSIRYGTSADSCNSTSAPNYTKAGYYSVYYKITYSYAGESMVENGVSYVWLLADNSKDEDKTATEAPHIHDYRYIETVAPSCTNLGFERWQCDGCGSLDKRNYTPALGHSYKAVTIRAASCKQGGLILHLCSKCGDFYEETTPVGSHDYEVINHNPTCRNVGYKEHICKACGDNFITDITPLISHSYEKITKQPTCTDKGYTTYICTMCNESYVSDYTEAIGHDWDEGHNVTSSTCEAEGVIEYNCKNCNEKLIKAEAAHGHNPGAAATCTEPQVCEDCGTVLALPKGHTYETTISAPSCTAMGYTIYKCKDCCDEYTADFTDKAEHNYHTEITAPTCTTMGYTTYHCPDCDDTYISDYTDKLPHKYKSVVTKPTCTAMGFTTYTCEECGDSYVSNYTEMTEHNFTKQVVEPTCTEHGYSIYKCPDCGKEYIGDYTDVKQHHYTESVTPPTCTEMGYTTFVCDDCGDTYKADYTDKAAHNFNSEITEPTCTAMGFTTFTCENCNFSYMADYKDMLGHTLSDWIIDTAATIEHGGEKHIECLTCGETLQTANIPQLIDKDNSDEDGKAQIGAYSIILTDKNGKPIFNSEISIDVNDKISIKLPESRLLDYADQTTITVFKTDTQAPVKNLNIFISDSKDNNATGITDTNGQLKAPNDKSSTGDNNGTIGGGDEDNKFTYVVTVKNKENIITDNCDIWIGESNNIVVDLPDGVKPTKEYPVIITVVDHNGNAQQDVTVIVIGDADFIEKGKTDIYGRVTLPVTNEGYTDENGKVNVDTLNVIVNDETGLIEKAFVIHNEDGTIFVTLPDGKSIGYDNRITVTVLDAQGQPVKDENVTVNDVSENSYSGSTDENGRLILPPTNEDMTDKDGSAAANGYNILVADEAKPIENAFVTMVDGKLIVKLPETSVITVDNRITVTVTDSENAPVKDMSVTVSDNTEKTETNLTDESGKAVVPPTTLDYTDVNGYGELNGYSVIVNNETGFIEKAYITLNITQSEPDAEGNTTEIQNISVKLPENVLIDYANRVTVTVLNKADKTPVAAMPITVTDNAEKTANAVTDKNGKIIVPPTNEDITDDKGNSDITDKPTENPDKPDETETVSYKVVVSDTTAVIPNAFVKIEGGKVYVTLPDTHTLTTSNQTTITVTDKDGKAVSGVSVTVADKNKSTATQSTNTNGQIVVPVKTSSGSSGGHSSSGGGGGGSSSYSTVNVKVIDKDGKTVSASKSVDSKGNITLTLPTGKVIDADNYYTITVTDNKGNVKSDTNVTLKDHKSGMATGTTDKNGVLILPATQHKAYIVGYPDGTFMPDGDMSRAEAAAIFARLIAEEKGEAVSGTKTSFTDVSKNEWYINYISYLEKYNVINGYDDDTFKPDAPVTRAEFVAMTVRYYALFNEVKTSGYTVKYTDVNSSYWAYNDVAYAKNIGWLNGYADGTFKGDNNITRAEVVTVVNHATGRYADENYINKNVSTLNKFTDMKNNSHWGYYSIMEAANTHMAVSGTDSETWVK